jgi:CP family cyanate transporter-like MFS transporter
LILLPIADRLLRQPWPYVLGGALCLAAIVGIMLGNDMIILASTALLGFAAAAVLVLIFALPPLLSAPGDVHRTSAAMFTVSYTCAVIVPIISGIAWDVSGAPFAAFVPVALSALLLIVCAPTVVPRSRERATTF